MHLAFIFIKWINPYQKCNRYASPIIMIVINSKLIGMRPRYL